MSKASEWAQANLERASKQPQGFRESREQHIGPYLDCLVDQNGQAEFFVNGNWGATLSPERVLALAAWILDVFGEPDGRSG